MSAVLGVTRPTQHLALILSFLCCLFLYTGSHVSLEGDLHLELLTLLLLSLKC